MQVAAYLFFIAISVACWWVIGDLIKTETQHRQYMAKLKRIREEFDQACADGRRGDAEDILIELLNDTKPPSV